ncbi:tRNA glutamyl-Q(34) synthetase GluQRS [Aliikangiella sp. IMCC44632]
MNNRPNSERTPWIGRFAPSPSGPLHFGSLVAALGSYLIAKQKAGLWLLRIEDIDPPRVVQGATHSILTTLEKFALYWDGEVFYQSQRQHAYQQALEQLKQARFIYPCQCSRRQIQQRSAGVYDGKCRQKPPLNKTSVAWRVKFEQSKNHFDDKVLGKCLLDSAADRQDFIVKRRDNIYAYQLAVVVDDIEQKVNHVVRGADILDSTPRQIFLYDCLQQPIPEYYHLPLALDEKLNKLSKSQFSAALSAQDASANLLLALHFLGVPLAQLKPLAGCGCEEILKFALQQWKPALIPNKNQVYTAAQLATFIKP